MVVSSIIRNIGIGAVIFLVAAVVWLYKDKQYYKQESERQTENVSQLVKADSLKFANVEFSSSQINDYLKYENSDLKKKLAETGVRENRITSLISQTLKYRDTVKKETDVSGMVNAIKNNISKEQSWSDSTGCLEVKGIVSFDGEKLKVVVVDREFQNKSDAVAYWERRQWRFLGIKTRFLGKKVFTAKTFDNCGESQIMRIEKK